MHIHRYPITARHKDHEFFLSDLNSFTRGTGVTQEIDPKAFLSDLTISLHCLDEESRSAVFTVTPPELDLTREPFLFVGQFRHATEVITMSFEDMHALAQRVPDHLGNLILIHSVGRCGSTLVSKAFESSATVGSLSEPDTFSQITEWRGGRVFPEPELQDLVNSCLRLATKPIVGASHPSPLHWAIKFRSQCIEIADWMAAAFPDARQLYLTREPLSWLGSAYRAFVPPELVHDIEFQQYVEDIICRMHPLAREFVTSDKPMDCAQVWLLSWIANRESQQRIEAAGVSFEKADYAEIKTDPESVMERLFAYAGVTVDAPEALKACLQRDSQTGSALARTEINTEHHRLPEADQTAAKRLLTTRGHLPVL